MNARFLTSGALTLAFALSVMPVTAATQNATKAAPPSNADELEEQAAALLDQPARYGEAARLYTESASLRSTTDARAIESLVRAAHLYHYANRLFDARKTMEQAANRALLSGDVLRASQANLEAALFAYKQGKRTKAGELGRKALKLAQSPLLTDEQRATVTARIRVTAVAGLIN